MPTSRPRYSVTDTGSVRALLDDAQRQWPDVRHREELVLRLARTGHDPLHRDQGAAEADQRRELPRVALKRLPTLVDVEYLLSDRAWQ